MKSELQKSKDKQLEVANKTRELNSSMLKQIDQIQQVSGIVEFLPLVYEWSKSTKKSFEGCCRQGDRYIEENWLNSPSTLKLMASKKLLMEEIEQNPTHNFE